MNKNTKIVAALIALGLVTPMAYATNGDHMMAVGAQSSALGGTGVANFMGADSAWANPAMLGKSKGDEVVGGITLFMPDVSNTGVQALSGVEQKSAADMSLIPDVSYSSRMSDNLTYGIAIAGIAGMGVDYESAPATHVYAKSTFSIARIIGTIAHNAKDYGVGFSPIMQYGSLALSYNATGLSAANYNPSESADSDVGYGYSIGGYFNVMPTMTVAASYTSEIAAQYGKQISGAGAGFGLTGAQAFGDDLNQPAEMKLGVAYTTGAYTLTADYKSIAWGSAAGYKDFNWKDQTIIALGVKYAGSGFWVGAGYNDASDPIEEIAAASFRNDRIDFFNNMFFPAVVESSYTFGGGYDISKNMAIEGAVVITPEVTKVVSVPDFGGTNTTKHSQSSYSVSLRYKF